MALDEEKTSGGDLDARLLNKRGSEESSSDRVGALREAKRNSQNNEIDGTPSAGVYALKFNTFVNAEQQPLNMIYIDWGDDNQQAITGADHHPDANNPHVFYHYYDSSPVGKTVTIRAWDNWGKNVTITRTISN